LPVAIRHRLAAPRRLAVGRCHRAAL